MAIRQHHSTHHAAWAHSDQGIKLEDLRALVQATRGYPDSSTVTVERETLSDPVEFKRIDVRYEEKAT